MRTRQVVQMFVMGLLTSPVVADEGKAGISVDQAIGIAQKKVDGSKVYDAQTRTRRDSTVYEVDLLSVEKFMEVEIDAANGKVLKIRKESAVLALWNFDKDPADALPPGWSRHQNNPTNALGEWTVATDPQAPSKPHVLSLKTQNGNATFNQAIADKTSFKDLELRVKIRGNTGEDDRGGGLIWRFKDENNYYLCRINPLEPNYRVYKVENGKRTMLQDSHVETKAGQWYRLRAVMSGDHIRCYLDGKKMLDVKDGTFKDAGKIGLWTKADASSSFDDLLVLSPHEETEAEKAESHLGSNDKKRVAKDIDGDEDEKK